MDNRPSSKKIKFLIQMKKFTYTDAAAVLTGLLPPAYLMAVYDSLPQTVPLHYGMDGKVDRYGNKSELLIVLFLIVFVSSGLYLLFKYLPAIDPKKQVKYSEETFKKLGFGIVFFLSLLNLIIVYTTANPGLHIQKLILPVISLLFAFLGNIMHNIKPNYFAGVRTPWTLESPDTWKATHRLTGKLWFAGGILLAVTTFLLPEETGTILFFCGTTVLVLVPVIYSYVYFKKHRLN